MAGSSQVQPRAAVAASPGLPGLPGLRGGPTGPLGHYSRASDRTPGRDSGC